MPEFDSIIIMYAFYHILNQVQEKKERRRSTHTTIEGNNNFSQEYRLHNVILFLLMLCFFLPILFHLFLYFLRFLSSFIQVASSMFIGCLSSNTSTTIVLCQQNNRMNSFAAADTGSMFLCCTHTYRNREKK